MEIDEEVVKRQLSIWLSSFKCDVYWEKKNKYGYPIFKAVNADGGTANKPDLLIIRNGRCYLCEVKNGNSVSNVCDSLPQILMYSCSDNRYTIDGDEIRPVGYLVATQYSIHGHLFPPFVDVLRPPETMGDGRIGAIRRGELPKNEHVVTEVYTRLLWRLGCESGESIGVLLSDALNNEMSVSPLYQYKHGKQQGIEVWA
jgi:hypothetical protein